MCVFWHCGKDDRVGVAIDISYHEQLMDLTTPCGLAFGPNFPPLAVIMLVVVVVVRMPVLMRLLLQVIRRMKAGSALPIGMLCSSFSFMLHALTI